MLYKEILPSETLQNFIKCFWIFQDTEKDVVNTILPDGYFDLILKIEDNKLVDLFLTGVWTKPKDVITKKGIKLIGIRCKLISAEFLFKQEINNILDSSTPLPLNHWSIDQLPYNNFNKFESLLSSSIIQYLQDLKKIDERKFKLFNILYQKEGCLEVSELSELIFWSSRQINRYFNKQFGFPLKTFLNILRCHASYKEIARGETSAPLNFYDQAHFIKEIKRHTGNTPKQLFNDKNDRFLQLKTIDKK